jgi:hypothetical protein
MAEQKTTAQPTMTTVTKDPAPGEETVLLKRSTPTPAPTHLNTILIAVSDSKHAEYAFNWVLNNVLREESIANTKVVLLTMQMEMDFLSLGSEAELYVSRYRATSIGRYLKSFQMQMSSCCWAMALRAKA